METSQPTNVVTTQPDPAPATHGKRKRPNDDAPIQRKIAEQLNCERDWRAGVSNEPNYDPSLNYTMLPSLRLALKSYNPISKLYRVKVINRAPVCRQREQVFDVPAELLSCQLAEEAKWLPVQKK